VSHGGVLRVGSRVSPRTLVREVPATVVLRVSRTQTAQYGAQVRCTGITTGTAYGAGGAVPAVVSSVTGGAV
jgi:hypothetical protein